MVIGKPLFAMASYRLKIGGQCFKNSANGEKKSTKEHICSCRETSVHSGEMLLAPPKHSCEALGNELKRASHVKLLLPPSVRYMHARGILSCFQGIQRMALGRGRAEAV